MEEMLRKLIFVQVHDWYEPLLCGDCVEFNFMLLPRGAVAFCEKEEDGKPCSYRKRKTKVEIENTSTSPLLELEIPQMEMM